MVGMLERVSRLTLIMVLFFVAALCIGALPASALHWCQPASIIFSPGTGLAGDTTTFSYTLRNNIKDALTVNQFYVTYSWGQTRWDLGTVTIIGQASHTFYHTVVLPASPGSYTIAFSVNGIATGDAFSETCNWQPTQFNVNSSPLGGSGGVSS